MNIWLDHASGSARDLEPHRKVAGAIADGYLAWAAQRLAPGTDGTDTWPPALFLATIEEMYLLNAIGRPAIAADAKIALSGPRSIL